ncbi:GNAT family N-acetyltransferase [Halomarina salina]|uniref:GNAT family N-acetyltransferase n=1 Tax=Halomarina salina TaxID=1872699 RepID=A0ABD5RR05_9EURY|nr:GNAT family protein [Halomarina salina]
MPGPLFAANDRVELHTMEEEDHDDIGSDMNHPDIRVPGGGPTGPADGESVTEFVDWLRNEGNTAFVVCAEGGYVGLVTLRQEEPQGNVGTYGIWITPESQGRGYATAASELLFDWAFDQHGLHKVVATVFDFNEASMALMDSLGFTEEGVHREERFADGAFHDEHYFGLLAHEWR